MSSSDSERELKKGEMRNKDDDSGDERKERRKERREKEKEEKKEKMDKEKEERKAMMDREKEERKERKDKEKERRDKIHALLVEREDGILGAMQLPNDIGDGEEKALGLQLQYKSTISIDNSQHRSRLIKETRRLLGEMFRDAFKSAAVKVSPPNLIRPAVVEACNMDYRQFPIVSCGDDPYLSLVGIGLPTMISFLVHKSLVQSVNLWPLVFFSSGMVYIKSEQMPHTFRQMDTFSALVLVQTQEAWMVARAQIQELLHTFFNSLGSPANFEPVGDTSLRFYERSASAIVANNGQNAGRISNVGPYIPQRIHLVVEHGSGKPTFPYLGFVEIDLSTVVDIIRNKV